MNASTLLAFAVLLAPIIFPLVSLLLQRLASNPKLSPTEQAALMGIAHYVVPAVEQTCGLLGGVSKKAEATRIISNILGDMGVSLSPAMIETAIESAVYNLNQLSQQTVKLPAVRPPAPSATPSR